MQLKCIFNDHVNSVPQEGAGENGKDELPLLQSTKGAVIMAAVLTASLFIGALIEKALTSLSPETKNPAMKATPLKK